MIQAVIIAGGKGSRLEQMTKKIPKPMVKIGHCPVLEHQINLCKRYGLKKIIILTGYLAKVIEEYFKDGKNFGVDINYIRSKITIGNADRTKLTESQLSDDFLVFYGDVMLDMDLKRLINFHKKKKSFCSLVLHPNDHPFDSDLVEIDNNQKIIAFHSKPHQPNQYFKNLVNAGVYLMSPKIFKYIKSKKGTELDFGKHIFPKIFNQEDFFGYQTPEYIKDMGTPERLRQVSQDYLNGKIQKFNLANKRKAIFLDRDGVINYDPDNLSKIDDFKLLPKVTKAIQLINSSDYLAIVITNQPMIAKGLLSFDDLDQIHKKMETLLGQAGAKLDGIYFCPHHPEKEFPGVPELRIECHCRKPKPGLIFQASQEYNIDLAHSWLIGDSQRDIGAGINAKIKTTLVKRNQEKFEKCLFRTKKADDLYSAVKSIIKK